MNDQKFVILDICQIDNKFSYLSNIEDARSQAELDIQILYFNIKMSLTL